MIYITYMLYMQVFYIMGCMQIVDTKKRTSVTVDESTRLELNSIGERLESYDKIIIRLIKFYKENHPSMKEKHQKK
jgi:hypothetical protein